MNTVLRDGIEIARLAGSPIEFLIGSIRPVDNPEDRELEAMDVGGTV